MSIATTTANPQGLRRVLGWRRARATLCISIVFGLLLSLSWDSGLLSILTDTVAIGLFAMLAFGLFEQWPKHLPAWFARWVLQVWGVTVAIPLSTLAIYLLRTHAGAPPFWQDPDRWEGFTMLCLVGLLFAPWIAVSALFNQISGAARSQALSFELERSELERKALDARMHLLQAQVEPHFLFNTLANVRELVDSGSPQASTVLDSLIAYLRAAVPRLHNPATTLGQELDLVRAYLEVMHMRIPDRLQYVLHVDDASLALLCPPMTLLTLVENAVRHGIDPSEDGGRIEVRVTLRYGRCVAQVIDTGVGLRSAGGSLGTGLATLRERLQLIFGHDAQLRLSELTPHGVCAELEFPARTETV
ncbi:MAG: sensor histidine kinase [Rhodanobacter sp.]